MTRQQPGPYACGSQGMSGPFVGGWVLPNAIAPAKSATNTTMTRTTGQFPAHHARIRTHCSIRTPYSLLGDVLPSLARNGPPNRIWGDAELLRKLSYRGTRRCEFSDFANAVVGEFREAMPFATQASSFRNHVGQVRGVISQKEMPGVNAPSVVACMTDDHPSRDYSDVEFVGKAVSAAVRVALGSKTSVPTHAFFTKPAPTSVRTVKVYAAPEPALRCSPSRVFDLRSTSVSVSGEAAIVRTTKPLPMARSLTSFDGADTLGHATILSRWLPRHRTFMRRGGTLRSANCSARNQ